MEFTVRYATIQRTERSKRKNMREWNGRMHWNVSDEGAVGPAGEPYEARLRVTRIIGDRSGMGIKNGTDIS